MFHVPYDTMAFFHARRVVADTTILLAVALLEAEMKVSNGLMGELKVCRMKGNEITLLNQDLMKRLAFSEADTRNAESAVDRGLLIIARLRPWATIGRIAVYGTVVIVVAIIANEIIGFAPQLLIGQ